MTQIYLVYCIILSKSISKDFVKKKKSRTCISINLSESEETSSRAIGPLEKGESHFRRSS